MLKYFKAFLLCLMMSTALFAEELPLRYDISVSLDPVTHMLSGSEDIEWRNTTGTPCPDLYFHLYLNAFANNHSTFMKELGDGTLRGRRHEERHWGWTKITKLEIPEGDDLLPALVFVRPDDGNDEDFTVARVELPAAVEPGAVLRIHLEFEALLPRVIARTGWAGDFHLVGQWFPKLGVYEEAGHGGRKEAGWNCHQFHASSEFYADFASYRVEIRVPEDFVVAATGIEVESRKIAEGESRELLEVFTADRVHDFAWCAAPKSLMSVVEADFEPSRDIPPGWLEEAMKDLDLSAAELELPPVHLRLLIPREEAALAERTLHAARLAIAWYGLHYGPYPYPQLSIISPPPAAGEAGGMEYPTFITTGGAKLMEYFPISEIPLIELVTIHEFGHQYFYGLLASNEFEQAWMDEGLNSFAEVSCRADIARDGLTPGRLNYSPWAQSRLEYSTLHEVIRVDRPAWEFRTRHNYSLASYTKTVLWLKTLEGIVGRQDFARAMRNYALEWRFRHPTGDDLMQSLSTSTGRDLDWFFAQAVEGDADVDWAVASVRTRRKEEIEGAVWNGEEWVEQAEKETEDRDEDGDTGPWTASFDVTRRGAFSGPVEVLLIFADGTQERRNWDGLARWRHFELETESRLDAVVVDPDGVWALETRRGNNYWRREHSSSQSGCFWSRSISRLLSLIPMVWS